VPPDRESRISRSYLAVKSHVLMVILVKLMSKPKNGLVFVVLEAHVLLQQIVHKLNITPVGMEVKFVTAVF